MPTFADRLLAFLTHFPAATALPDDVLAYHPYQEPTAHGLLTQFAHRFYADNQPRVAILGINPGRFGGGTTGIAFTDPAALALHCHIPNELPRRAELSSQFVYQLIAALGGPQAFYQHFYLGSLYPLVLLRHGLNHNYYDAPALTQALWPDMQTSLREQAALGLRRDVVVCLGRRNGEYFARLNNELGLFERVVVFDHPRYLMQYKRRFVPDSVTDYARVLGELVSSPTF
ncbi:uracil-DNA glycosylase family protein [Hymenobacter koreensis]|uniref:Uracil-DNA glycosylase-like domain-containing protein n=1 Tax=Hymenobacter koreensis TaxID=1084523 RepID=A0ABP8J5W3_9BACT